MKYKKIVVELYPEPCGKIKIEIPNTRKDIDKIGETILKIMDELKA